uniref:Uncharacterized protein n=1 Tax=Rhipicephalus zambeziensis TaxID=60191 RepID=A0A224YGG3_9ACAR
MGTSLRGRWKLISIFIGADLSLFITNTHGVFLFSVITEFTLPKAGASRGASREDAVCVPTELVNAKEQMRFMCADCEKAPWADPCFKHQNIFPEFFFIIFSLLYTFRAF